MHTYMVSCPTWSKNLGRTLTDTSLTLKLKSHKKPFSQTDTLTLDCSLRQTFLLKAFWMKIHDASWSHFFPGKSSPLWHHLHGFFWQASPSGHIVTLSSRPIQYTVCIPFVCLFVLRVRIWCDRICRVFRGRGLPLYAYKSIW